MRVIHTHTLTIPKRKTIFFKKVKSNAKIFFPMFWRFATSNSTAPGTRAEAVPPRHVSPFRGYSWHALHRSRAPLLQEREDPFVKLLTLDLFYTSRH